MKKIRSAAAAVITICLISLSVFAVPAETINMSMLNRGELISYVLYAGVGIFLIGMLFVLLSLYVKLKNKDNGEDYDDYLEEDTPRSAISESDEDLTPDSDDRDIDELPDDEALPTDKAEVEAPIDDEDSDSAEVETPIEAEDSDDAEVEVPIKIDDIDDAEVETPIDVEDSDDAEVEVPIDVEDSGDAEVEVPIKTEDNGDAEVKAPVKAEGSGSAAAEAPKPSKLRKVRITLAGVNNPDVKVMEFVRTGTIGRRATNDIMISDNAVSRHHCEFTYRDDTVYIKDLDSTNGTLLNGERVIVSKVNSGDIIVIGKHEYKLSITVKG